jgi:hypothetical protein
LATITNDGRLTSSAYCLLQPRSFDVGSRSWRPRRGFRCTRHIPPRSCSGLGSERASGCSSHCYLRGWDRNALGPEVFLFPEFPASRKEWAEARSSGWLFTTDKQGRFTVRIGDFAVANDDAPPGWGTYALVINPGSNDAGAVSQRFWSGSADQSTSERNWPPEWGQPLPLPPEGLTLTVRLHRGFTFRGTLVNDRNHRTPLRNITVTTWNDLGIDTHTGYGGQIFYHSATTNAEGGFKIPHEYDNKLYVKTGGLSMTTQHHGWVPQKEDTIDPPKGNELRLQIGALINQQFHYTGRVTDAEGKPVAGADVVMGISSQPEAESWGDYHHFEQTRTGSDGKYDLAATSPWGRFLSAEDKVHGRVDLNWPGYDSPIPPGSYNLTFPAKP